MPGGVGGQRREPLPTRLEMYLKNRTIGAEHRDIIPDNQFNQLVFAKDK